MAEIVPVISREFTKEDREMSLERVVSSDINSLQMGQSGKKHEIVEHECPRCDYDQLIRTHSISPVFPDTVDYYCLNPNCPHFVRDELSYACKGSYPQGGAVEPVVTE